MIAEMRVSDCRPVIMSSSYTLEPSWELLKIQINLIGLELHIDISISTKVHANFDIKLNLRAIILEKLKREIQGHSH